MWATIESNLWFVTETNFHSQGEVVPRVVFLLTDGQFSDQDKILALVDAHVHQSSVHTIGIGQDVVEEDLKTIAQHGKGLALSVKTVQGNALQARIIELLQSKLLTRARKNLCKHLTISGQVSCSARRQLSWTSGCQWN